MTHQELRLWTRKIERWAMMGVPHQVMCRWLINQGQAADQGEADEFLRRIDDYLDNH